MAEAKVKIEWVSLYPGETLTVCMRKGGHDDPTACQIELWLDGDGVIRVFCDESLPIHAFAEWEALRGGHDAELKGERTAKDNEAEHETLRRR